VKKKPRSQEGRGRCRLADQHSVRVPKINEENGGKRKHVKLRKPVQEPAVGRKERWRQRSRRTKGGTERRENVLQRTKTSVASRNEHSEGDEKGGTSRSHAPLEDQQKDPVVGSTLRNKKKVA